MRFNARQRVARWLVAALAAAMLSPPATGQEPIRSQPMLRRPIALVAADHWLFAANRHSGTVSIIDTAQQAVVDEVRLGEQLADLALTRDAAALLAVDEARGELILVRRRGHVLRVMQRLAVATAPVTIRVSGDGTFCTVASLWARRMTIVGIRPGGDSGDTTAAPPLAVLDTIDLPFAPRLQWLGRDDTALIVADAFGGQLAVIHLDRHAPGAAVHARLAAVWSLDGHNIRGLAPSADGRELLIAHQMLNPMVPTIHSRVFWGNLLTNVIRSVSIDMLLSKSGAGRAGAGAPRFQLAHWSLYSPGEPGKATGDPGAMLVVPGGPAVVALGGVDEVAVWRGPTGPFERRSVGHRPTALAMAPDQRVVYVANTFSDTVSVLDLATGRTTDEIALGPQPPLTSADRGEMLFYDAKLSLDGWYSCHSCHTDGHSNGLLNDNFSDGTFDTPKRVLSLLGTGDTGPWSWAGAKTELRQQVHKSIEVTMQAQKKATDANVEALAAYLQTLKPPPSLDAARGVIDRNAVARGRKVFDRLDCAQCHRRPTYTSTSTFDVGLRDEAALAKFNPPSLRGVSQRSSYFHDNRAADLREVFTKYKHPDGDELPPADVDDLVAFLRSL